MKLTIENLSKRYANGVQALTDVNLEITNGMFGLLGPNGAGKSTLMRILATLQEADTGNVRLDDIDVLTEKLAVKRVLGYLPQEFDFFAKETARGLLNHFAVLKGLKQKREREMAVERLLDSVNLLDAAKQKLGTFSGGMKQRFGIALVLLGSPKLIIVDEPTAGLDPEERKRFHNILSEIGENIIVILSTHIVEDVSDLCGRMAVINKGRIVMQGRTLSTIESMKGKIWEKKIPRDQLEFYEQNHRVLSSRLFAGDTFIRVYCESPPAENFIPAEAKLEDAYFFYQNDKNWEG